MFPFLEQSDDLKVVSFMKRNSIKERLFTHTLKDRTLDIRIVSNQVRGCSSWLTSSAILGGVSPSDLDDFIVEHAHNPRGNFGVHGGSLRQ